MSTSGIKPIEKNAVELALEALRQISAPTKRAALIAQTITQLSTQAAVNEFTSQIRRNARVQDLSILPESMWTLTRRIGSELRDGGRVTTSDLRYLIGDSEFRIDWPSVTFHWGVAVTFCSEGGVSWTARSADWQLTETYMSS